MSLPVTIIRRPWRTLALTLVLSWFLRTVAYLIRVRKFPPGPKKHIVMDNRGDMPYPKTHVWRSFHYWHKQFGPVISFYLGRRPVICVFPFRLYVATGVSQS